MIHAGSKAEGQFRIDNIDLDHGARLIQDRGVTVISGSAFGTRGCCILRTSHVSRHIETVTADIGRFRPRLRKLIDEGDMKIKIEVDTTPEEMRQFLGLPDVADIQSDLIAKVRERMQAGAQGYDPLALLKPLMPENLRSMEAFQKAFWENISAGSKDTD